MRSPYKYRIGPRLPLTPDFLAIDVNVNRSLIIVGSVVMLYLSILKLECPVFTLKSVSNYEDCNSLISAH